MFDATRQVPASLTIDAMNAARVGERDRVAARLVAESWRLGHSVLRCFVRLGTKPETPRRDAARALGGSANDGDASVARAYLRCFGLAAAAEGRPDPDLVAAARVGAGFHHARAPYLPRGRRTDSGVATIQALTTPRRSRRG